MTLRLCVSVFQTRPRTRELETQSHREHGESPWFSSILFFSLRLCVSVFQTRPRTRKLETQSHREHGESTLVFFNSVFFSAPLCLCVLNPTAHPVVGNTESQRTRREPEASDRSEISVGRGPVARFL